MPSYIIVGLIWQILGRRAFLTPLHPWAAPKKTILNRVKSMTWISVLKHSGQMWQLRALQFATKQCLHFQQNSNWNFKWKLNQDDFIMLDLQDILNSSLSHVINEIYKLQKNYSKLAADLDISESVFKAMKSQIVLLEPTSWSNNQYSQYKFQFLKISCLSSNIEVS